MIVLNVISMTGYVILFYFFLVKRKLHVM